MMGFDFVALCLWQQQPHHPAQQPTDGAFVDGVVAVGAAAVFAVAFGYDDDGGDDEDA